ncbi:3-hydroxyacyl-CoA dehydrogenase NAD-binding domain-containing protein, partial [Vagococcus teuberi]
MDIKNVMVVGAGQMGNGIVQVLATVGYNVYMNDINDTATQNGLDKIKGFLEKSVKRGSKTEDEVKEILDRITLSTSYEDAKNVDLVIEAATENKKIKLDIFRQL